MPAARNSGAAPGRPWRRERQAQPAARPKGVGEHQDLLSIDPKLGRTGGDRVKQHALQRPSFRRQGRSQCQDFGVANRLGGDSQRVRCTGPGRTGTAPVPASARRTGLHAATMPRTSKCVHAPAPGQTQAPPGFGSRLTRGWAPAKRAGSPAAPSRPSGRPRPLGVAAHARGDDGQARAMASGGSARPPREGGQDEEAGPASRPHVANLGQQAHTAPRGHVRRSPAPGRTAGALTSYLEGAARVARGGQGHGLQEISMSFSGSAGPR